MGSFFLLISAFGVVLSLIYSHLLLFCAAGDSLAAGQSISVYQTIVSAGQIFALGFFTAPPGNLRYAGIWYNRLPGERTVVWVANRENPLRDPAGVLTVTGDGNIAVLDGMGRTVWSTNQLPGVDPRSNTSAVLLDSGNLVLIRHGNGDGDNVSWQSFDHHADTALPGMTMRTNLSTGVSTRMTSWRGAADPSPGQFVYTVDPKTSVQGLILRGSEIIGRQKPWDGRPSITVQRPSDSTTIFVGNVVKGDDVIYWNIHMAGDSVLGRFVLDYTGKLAVFTWEESSHEWVSVFSFPARPCDFYNRCGPFAACVHHNQSSCRCLDGFQPRSPEEWKMENFTGGCVRRHRLRCDGTDSFEKVSEMKLPDGFSVVWDKKSRQQCEAECSAMCLCQGYAYADLITSEGKISGSRCLIWNGDMKDVAQTPGYTEDFYVRRPASELEGNNTRLEDGVFPGKNKHVIKIIVPILSVGMLLLGICCYFSIKIRKSRVARRRSRSIVPPQGLDITRSLGSGEEMPDTALLDFKIVKAATSDFCSENKLGEGGFGPVYKGTFYSGQQVAVKRLSKGSKQGYQEFHNEVRLIARLQHNNLVRLLGWCTHKDEKILIYEYMPNKSLDKFVFDPTRSAELNWEKRFNIIKGIANGLLYLHLHSRMRVIHRDLKTSNILLDSEMNPKISDFGLARTFQTNQDREKTQRIVGTYGYMSPEYALNGVFSEKSDVFSFGVILLEIITGKRSTGFYPHSDSHQSLFGYAWQMWEGGRALELGDPSMLRGSSSSATTDQQVLRCTQLAMLCMQENVADRPTMSYVVFSLSSADICTMPMPKKPAFVLGLRDPQNPSSLASHNISPKASVNELTRTSVQGR